MRLLSFIFLLNFVFAFSKITEAAPCVRALKEIAIDRLLEMSKLIVRA